MFNKMKMPEGKEMEMELSMEPAEGEMEEGGMEGPAVDLSVVSDQELLDEARKRGLV